MKRPMLYWVSLFILGEVLSKSVPISLIGLIVAGILILLYCIPVANKDKCRNYMRDNQKLLAFGLLFFLLGVACMQNAERKIDCCNLQEGTAVYFCGTVTAAQDSDFGTEYIVAVHQMKAGEKDWLNIRVHVRISLEVSQDIMPGSRIVGNGMSELFANATNPGGYDEQSYQYGKGIFLALENVTIDNVEQPLFPVREFLHRLRQHLSMVYQNILEEKNASLASAMVLGDKSLLDKEIKQLYQQNGIAHLIAISGLHIAMIGGTLYHVLRKLLGGYKIAAVAGITFIILYGMMTGLSGATLRAVIMLMVSIGAEVSGRRYDGITSIALALLVMLLQNPYQITQVGFLLSFGAIIGITVVNPIWKYIWPQCPRCMEGLFISISVQLVLVPVMLYYFYEIPLYGVLLNIVVVPLMSILLAVLILCGILGSFWLPVARFVVLPAQGIFVLYEGVCHASEKLPLHTICTGRPDIWWIIVYYAVVGLFLVAAYRKKWDTEKISGEKGKLNKKRYTYMMMGTGIIYGLLFFVFLLPGPLTICIFDVGQGDGIYIRTPANHHILMDGGSSSRQKIGTYILKDGIRYYGGDVLEYVFISHSDSDHYSGIAELLEKDLISIRNVVLPAIANPDEDYCALERKAREKGCKIYYMKQGDCLKIDGLTFLCLNPKPVAYEDKNTGSLVLKLTYGDFDMLLTGDMDQSVEKRIVQENLRTIWQSSIEVLKVAHHGSATASSEDFLKVLQPKAACISVGAGNHYGHPAKEVMERLSQNAEKIYLTKDSGAITIETNGKQYRIGVYNENN